MKSPISLDDVLFDVGHVPIEAVIGSNGSTPRIQVPGKKALINEGTGLAARPPDNPLFQKGRDTIEKRAGAWLQNLARESQGAVLTESR